MLYVDGRTMRQVGELLGVSGGRVAQLIRRAERELRSGMRRASRERSPHVERLRAVGALCDLSDNRDLSFEDFHRVEIPPP